MIILTVLAPGGTVTEMASKLAKFIGYAGNYANVVRVYNELEKNGAGSLEKIMGVGTALFMECGNKFTQGMILNKVKNKLEGFGASEPAATSGAKIIRMGFSEVKDATVDYMTSEEDEENMVK